ncbi:C40 family peptidase [Alphaproteobacteria bacterium]|nr:C40 family peptidase [Alphaproteobacteria bacterium]
MNDLFQIITPSAPIRNSSNTSSSLISEALFGECFKVIERHNACAYGVNLSDNYVGWVELSKMGKIIKPTHIVHVPRTLIYSEPSVYSNIIQYLPFSSLITIVNENNNWSEIKINDILGYISKNHYVDKNQQESDWVKYAELLLNTPYHFGGRDSIGLDCSALLQLSIKFAGVSLERDTKDQVNSKLLKNSDGFKIKRGSIIFWKNHVAIGINNYEIIHANAYHMTTNIETFEEANRRIQKTNGKITCIKEIINE